MKVPWVNKSTAVFITAVGAGKKNGSTEPVNVNNAQILRIIAKAIKAIVKIYKGLIFPFGVNELTIVPMITSCCVSVKLIYLIMMMIEINN